MKNRDRNYRKDR